MNVPWVCSAPRTVVTVAAADFHLHCFLLGSLAGSVIAHAAAVPTACPIPRLGGWRSGASPCRRLVRLRLCVLRLGSG